MTFIDSSTTKIWIGASLANLFIPKPALALPTLTESSGSVITTNRQGWALQAEGDKRAASNMRSNFSISTERDIS